MGKPSDNYREVKNFLENELGINKDTIADICTKIIERSIEGHVEKFFQGPRFSAMISEQINKGLTSDRGYFGGLSTEAVRAIKKNVNDFLMAEIKAKVNIKEISVEVIPADPIGPDEVQE